MTLEECLITSSTSPVSRGWVIEFPTYNSIGPRYRGKRPHLSIEEGIRVKMYMWQMYWQEQYGQPPYLSGHSKITCCLVIREGREKGQEMKEEG